MLMKPAILRHDDMFFNIYIFSLYIQQMPAVYWESLKKKETTLFCCVLCAKSTIVVSHSYTFYILIEENS